MLPNELKGDRIWALLAEAERVGWGRPDPDEYGDDLGDLQDAQAVRILDEEILGWFRADELRLIRWTEPAEEGKEGEPRLSIVWDIGDGEAGGETIIGFSWLG